MSGRGLCLGESGLDLTSLPTWHLRPSTNFGAWIDVGRLGALLPVVSGLVVDVIVADGRR